MSKGNRVAFSEMILQDILKENDKIKAENTKLKEALRKCSPYEFKEVAPETYEGFCKFCSKNGLPQNGHKDDCEYVRLCGKDINVATKDGGAE